ncbi:Bifunctional F420 biosynthesis protein FbiB [Kitasatospora aureofaciens]
MGDDLAGVILGAVDATGAELRGGNIVVVASKVVSVAEKRYVDLATVTPSPEAVEISARTGKPAAIVQLILDHSSAHYLATKHRPITARHRLGYQLTSAGIDRAGTDGAWLLPAAPDASARHLRDALTTATGAQVAVVIADSDGQADRRRPTVISIGAAGIAPLRTTGHGGKRQEETFTDDSDINTEAAPSRGTARPPLPRARRHTRLRAAPRRPRRHPARRPRPPDAARANHGRRAATRTGRKG